MAVSEKFVQSGIAQVQRVCCEGATLDGSVLKHAGSQGNPAAGPQFQQKKVRGARIAGSMVHPILPERSNLT